MCNSLPFSPPKVSEAKKAPWHDNEVSFLSDLIFFDGKKVVIFLKQKRFFFIRTLKVYTKVTVNRNLGDFVTRFDSTF